MVIPSGAYPLGMNPKADGQLYNLHQEAVLQNGDALDQFVQDVIAAGKFPLQQLADLVEALLLQLDAIFPCLQTVQLGLNPGHLLLATGYQFSHILPVQIPVQVGLLGPLFPV